MSLVLMAQNKSVNLAFHFGSQVVASILRNLSWRADINSKRALRDVGSVSALIKCALQATKVMLSLEEN